MLVETGQNLNLIERLITVWNSPSADGVCEIYAADYRGLDITDRSAIEGVEGVTRQLLRYNRAFPDLTFLSEKTVTQSDSIAFYWTARGTHSGELLNIPPTGSQVHVHGMTLFMIENNKIKRGVHLWDMAGLLRSIGLLPELVSRPPLDMDLVRASLNLNA